MAEDREVRVKLTADVAEYVAAMNHAKDATTDLVEAAGDGDVQRVRTGASHRFPRTVATDPANQFAFKVDALPSIDFAAEALKAAQRAYAEKWDLSPDAMTNFIWTIRKAG